MSEKTKNAGVHGVSLVGGASRNGFVEKIEFWAWSGKEKE